MAHNHGTGRIAWMLVVAALGGNALLRRGEPADEAHQRHNVELAVDSLTELARHHQVVVTHGNGRRWACWRCRARPIRRSLRIRWTCSAPSPRA
jgi:hypothetical protein